MRKAGRTSATSATSGHTLVQNVTIEVTIVPKPAALFVTDVLPDGSAIVGVDMSGDGSADAYGRTVDTTGDGVADSVAIDSNQDGMFETVVCEWRPEDGARPFSVHVGLLAPAHELRDGTHFVVGVNAPVGAIVPLHRLVQAVEEWGSHFAGFLAHRPADMEITSASIAGRTFAKGAPTSIAPHLLERIQAAAATAADGSNAALSSVSVSEVNWVSSIDEGEVQAALAKSGGRLTLTAQIVLGPSRTAGACCVLL